MFSSKGEGQEGTQYAANRKRRSTLPSPAWQDGGKGSHILHRAGESRKLPLKRGAVSGVRRTRGRDLDFNPERVLIRRGEYALTSDLSRKCEHFKCTKHRGMGQVEHELPFFEIEGENRSDGTKYEGAEKSCGQRGTNTSSSKGENDFTLSFSIGGEGGSLCQTRS